MGILDKILKNQITNNGISQKINKETDKIKTRAMDTERELELRIAAGEDVQEYYVTESRYKKLPYDCFFDWEIEMVEKALDAKDTLQSTLNLIFCAIDYVRDNKVSNDNPLKSFNLSHSKIWIEELVQRAEKGYLCAKAAFWGKNFDPFPELKEMLFEYVDDVKKNEYLSDVKKACENSNRDVMTAYAFFLLRGEENKEEQREMYMKAGKLGSSEAYHELFFDCQNDRWNSEEGFQYAKAAAECDDGPYAYSFQDKLGDAYYYGDGWNVEIDKKQAVYWYRRAANNGYNISIETLKRLEKNGEL